MVTRSEIYTEGQRPGREREHGETNPHHECLLLEARAAIG